MPDVILDTAFNNSNLPIVLLGFTDTFERPDAATLGITSGEGKPWVKSGSDACTIVSGKAVLPATGAAGVEYVVTNLPNGTLRGVLGAAGTRQGGLIARISGGGSGGVRLVLRASGSNFVYVLQELVGGVATNIGASTGASADGDVIEMTLNGANVTVTVNGVVAIGPVATSVLTGNAHGLYIGAPATGITWDEISFT